MYLRYIYYKNINMAVHGMYIIAQIRRITYILVDTPTVHPSMNTVEYNDELSAIHNNRINSVEFSTVRW